MTPDWKDIKTAPCVGKKTLMFWPKTGNRKIIIGYRCSGSDDVIGDDGKWYKATHWDYMPKGPGYN